jgi:acyl-CoA dehydrogenase
LFSDFEQKMASLCRNVNLFSRIAPLTLKRGLAHAPPATGGLNFKLSEEQQELVDLAEKFTKEEVIPNAAHYDQVEKS